MTRIVFLNGPPGCGKDTAVSRLVPYLQFTHLKFAAPIKRMLCALLQEDMKWLEMMKDQPHRTLALHQEDAILQEWDTPRATLIALSETFLKPRYGKDFFGRVMLNEISKSANSLIILSDSGFLEEALPVVKKYGHGNCLHLKLYRDTKTFDGDSRSYWSIPKVQQRNIYNDTTPHNLTMQVLRAIMRQWPDIESMREPEWIK